MVYSNIVNKWNTNMCQFSALSHTPSPIPHWTLCMYVCLSVFVCNKWSAFIIRVRIKFIVFLYSKVAWMDRSRLIHIHHISHIACLIQDYEIITPNHLQLFSIISSFVLFLFLFSSFVRCSLGGFGFCSIIICVKPKIMIEFVNENFIAFGGCSCVYVCLMYFVQGVDECAHLYKNKG